MEVLRPTSDIMRLPVPSRRNGLGADTDGGSRGRSRRGQELAVNAGAELKTGARHALAVREVQKSQNSSTIFEKAVPRPSQTTTYPHQLAPGQASIQFIAQQLAQSQVSTELATGSAHANAAQAYNETHGLTAVVLGFDGFQQRVA